MCSQQRLFDVFSILLQPRDCIADLLEVDPRYCVQVSIVPGIGHACTSQDSSTPTDP